MYGIVNKAIEDLVKENFGEETWHKIRQRSGVDIDFFVGTEAYDDSVTFKLAMAAAEETGMSVENVLIAFGEWWVLRTAKEKYGSLMAAGGASLKEFLTNLPSFHNRIALVYPKLTPPEFRITHIEENSLHVRYYSKRQGLQEFVRGLLQGLGILFKTPVTLQLLATRNEGHDHETFRVSW